MVLRDLSVRYKNSFLGFLWSMLNPLSTVLVLTFVFKYLQHNKVPNFSAYILAAYLPYMFFQMAIMDSAQSILGNISLIKKIYFPREILPLSSIISNFIHFILALGVFFAYLLAIALWTGNFHVFQWTSLYLPLLVAINFLLAAGLGLYISAVNTFYEDVKYLVGVILSLLFFLSPIMYFSETVFYNIPMGQSHIKYYLYQLNPIATLSTTYRKVLLAPQAVEVNGVSYPSLAIDWRLVGITAAFSLFIFFFGYHKFNQLKWKFVERP